MPSDSSDIAPPRLAGKAPGGGNTSKSAVYDNVMECDSDDECSLVEVISSPMVGLLRRGKYVKNKRIGSDDIVAVGATVKKGAPLCSIEQLGVIHTVKAPVNGEVVAFLVDDGTPVGYKTPIIEIRSSA